MNLAGKAIGLAAGLVALAALTTGGATADPGNAGPAATPPSFRATIAESREALRRILNGDPSGYVALFADREDITLGNPFGPFGKGRDAVRANLNNAATKYRDGSVLAVDRIATYGDGKMLVLVEVEHGRARLGASPDFGQFAARVTTVFERSGRRWKLVHRHADPITSSRPAESMLGK
jgi:ketosteroid isomerase-like protein